ncbi:MAG TPA: 50S ribosomal protein L18 [Xanthobacteraceae bacterium]|nr:50S ribosomal protein L18 [Xanthobacteraceae bacterium]
MPQLNKQAVRRQGRVRRVVRAHAAGRPRLSVFRSSKHIYAQLIDDRKGETLVSASTMEKTLREQLKTGADVEAAKAVGKALAERATAKGVADVVFDRGQYRYHGRIKALADAAREGGLKF